MGMLGAGLSAMGDTLGKYAMQRISSDEALAREKSLADYKIEMQEKMEARAAEIYAKKVGTARTAAQGSLQGRIDESTRLPGLLSLQAESESVFNRGGPPGGPVIRGGEVTTEMALADLNAADRDIYKRNIEENIAYAKGLKPSASQIEAETYHQLRSTDAETAKKFGTELKNEAEIAKLLRPEKADTKFFHRERTGEIVAVTATGEVVTLKQGVEPPTKDKEGKLTSTQKSNNDEIDLARKQVRIWQEKNPKTTIFPSEMHATVSKANQRKTGADPQFDIFAQNIGEGRTQRELQAQLQDGTAAKGNTSATGVGKPPHPADRYKRKP
jgi:hypothetical protein